MSNIQAVTYEDAVDVTLSDTVNDPAGPFAGLLVCSDGDTIKFTSRTGTITLAGGYAGQIIPIMVRRVWNTGTSATVVGLLALPYKGAPNPSV